MKRTGGTETEVRYIVDDEGRPREVMLAIAAYDELLGLAGDAEALAAFKRAKREFPEQARVGEARG